MVDKELQEKIEHDLYSLLHKHFEENIDFHSSDIYDMFEYSLSQLRLKTNIKIILSKYDRI